MENRLKTQHVVKNLNFCLFFDQTASGSFPEKNHSQFRSKITHPPLQAPHRMARSVSTDLYPAANPITASKTSHFRRKKNFIRQSPVNPRSDRKTRPADRSQR
jgi:hypothetical protein